MFKKGNPIEVSRDCGLGFSALELLLIKKRIKGPCWLSIAAPQRVASSSQVYLAALAIVADHLGIISK